LIVIDASALLEILLRTDRADRLMERAISGSEQMHAPQLLDIEVTRVLRRLVQQKEITAARAEQAPQDLADVLIERHEHEALAQRIWQLRDSLSAYDGAYVALAEALAAPLLNLRRKIGGLSRAPGNHRASRPLTLDRTTEIFLKALATTSHTRPTG
jgi:predicted nucleic acid-binding protein